MTGVFVHIYRNMNSDDNRYLKEAFGDDKKKKWLKDNPTLTPEDVDSYIKRFDGIRKSRPAAAKNLNIDVVPKGADRFDISKYNDWHSFETFVDAVGAQTQLKGEKLSDNLEIDAKPLFESNGLEVYYADNPQACIKYKGSIPYSWCVARPDSSNMFYNYRLGYNNPAFYFVKDVEATQKELSSIEKFTGKFNDKWHFFVIQVLNTANINNLTDKNYVVTSANNEGDIPMNWNEIVKIQPKLNGLQSEFLPKPLSDDELVVINKYKNGLTTQEFIKLTYNEKERFLDVYPRLNKPITDEIFNTLPYELKNKYIGMNIGLSDAQYNSIQSDKNLLKRYVQMVEKKFENWLKNSYTFKLVNSELDVLNKYKILNKYVDKLTDANVEELFRTSPNIQQTIDILLNNGLDINKIWTNRNVEELFKTSPNIQQTIDTLLNSGLDINKILTNRNVEGLIDKAVSRPNQVLRTSPNIQQTIDILLNNGLDINKIWTVRNVQKLLMSSLNLKGVQETIDILLNSGLDINKILTVNNVQKLLSYHTPNIQLRQRTIDILLNKNVPLTDEKVSYLIWSYCTNEQQKQRFRALKDKQLSALKEKQLSALKLKKEKQLSALKLNQQLSETKFKYRDFYSYLK